MQSWVLLRLSTGHQRRTKSTRLPDRRTSAVRNASWGWTRRRKSTTAATSPAPNTASISQGRNTTLPVGVGKASTLQKSPYIASPKAGPHKVTLSSTRRRNTNDLFVLPEFTAPADHLGPAGRHLEARRHSRSAKALPPQARRSDPLKLR